MGVFIMKRRYRTVCTIAAVIAAVGMQLSAYGATAVERHGELKTDGPLIVNKNGNIVQLRGMSFYWSTPSWNGYKYYNAGTVDALVDTWKCTVVRAAYDRNEGNNNGWDGVQTVINEAIKKGIYVIIDWHSHTAEAQASSAIQFFKEQAGKYKNTPNVIFEPYNEPINGAGAAKDGTQDAALVTWKKIKPYLQDVTQAIRDAGAENLVVVGTPYFCQFVNVAASDPLKDKNGKPFTNLAYSFHFYAASHGRFSIYAQQGDEGGMESDYLDGALGKIPIFVTEWGTTHSDGGQQIDEKNTDWWFDNYMNGDYHLSTCNWSASDFESSSAFSGSANNASASGKIVMRLLKAQSTDEYPPKSKTGDDGPAVGTVASMPATYPAAQYMNVYGGNINRVNNTVPFNSRDSKEDVRTAANTCIPVLVGANGDWVSYEVNNSKATKYFCVRSRPTSTGSEGKIDVLIDDKSIGSITVKDTGWQTGKIDTDVATGKHTIKLVFSTTKGDGFLVEWIELTDTVVAVTGDRIVRVSGIKGLSPVSLATVNNGFTLAVPPASGFSTYRLFKVDGKTVRAGALTPVTRIDGLAEGVWFVELNGSYGKKVLNAAVFNK